MEARLDSANGEGKLREEIPVADGNEVQNTAPKAADAVEADTTPNGVAVLPTENPDETNVWPTATEEASFLSEAQGRGEKIVPVARETIEDVQDSAKALPKLDELVNRIPAEARELLDELFRVKFTTVRRVKKADLKP